jgi:plastocyanin
VIAQPPPPPQRVQVVAAEFRLALSRPSLVSGAALVELANFGQDGHDLALRRAQPGSRTWRLRRVPPGRAAELSVTLRPGRYVLWCTLPGHRAAGMQATLVVRARQR